MKRVSFGVERDQKMHLCHANRSFLFQFLYSTPISSHIATLITTQPHESVLHSGVNKTVREVRAKYWIPIIQQKVKELIKYYIKCKIYQGPNYTYPKSPPLQEERVSAGILLLALAQTMQELYLLNATMLIQTLCINVGQY